MNNIFVRPARESDTENFTKWFLQMGSFTRDVFELRETYSLCAFKKNRIIGYAVVNFGHGIQVLSRFVFDPNASELEKALASKELLETVIVMGHLQNLGEIYFVGDNGGTNRIASHAFRRVDYPEYQHVFDKSQHPVYRLRLRELE